MKWLGFLLQWILCVTTFPAFGADGAATSEADAWVKAEESLKAYLKPIVPNADVAEYRSVWLRTFLPEFRLYVRLGPNDSRPSTFLVSQSGAVINLGEGVWTGAEPGQPFHLPSITEFIRSRKIHVKDADDAIEMVRLIEDIQGAYFYVDFIRRNTAGFKVFEKDLLTMAHGSPDDWTYSASPLPGGWRVAVQYVGPPTRITAPPVYEITTDDRSFFSNIHKLPESVSAPKQSSSATKASFAIVIADSGTPIITDADLIEYRFAEHALEIRTEALSRFPPMTSLQKPFHVLVNGEIIYTGQFVSVMSSRSYKEPIIITSWETNRSTTTVTIHRPYFHEPRFQTGPDVRSDDRLRQALIALGKFAEGDVGAGDYDAGLTDKISDILKECQNVTKGMTRAELLKVFITEGGLSTAKQRTFVHRRCPFIKVDVEFTLSGPQQTITEERLSDTISRISQPYLHWSIND